MEAPPPLAAALRASKRALLLSLEKELRVSIFVSSSVLVVGRGPVGGGGGGSTGADDASLGQSIEAGGGRGRGGGRGHDLSGRRGEGTTAVEVVEVTIRGVPENIKAARINLAELERDCVEAVVPVERRSLNAVYGPGGANLRQMEVL